MREDPVLGVAIFGFFAFAYIWASPSLAHQGWDSLGYARVCEVNGLLPLWGNHPLGNLLECAAFTAVRRLGYQGRALPVMAVFNGVTAAAAVVALLVVLRSVLLIGRLESAGWAVILGSAYGFWHGAGTADVYTSAVLLLIVAWGVILSSFDRPSPARGLLSGIAFAAAAICNQFGGVILTIGMIAMIGSLRSAEERDRRQLVAALGIFATTAAATIVVGYALLGILGTGSSSPASILRWVVGHGNDSAYGRFFTPYGAFFALRSAVITLLGHGDRWPVRSVLLVVAVSGLALSLLGAMWIRSLPDRLKTIALACGLQCIVGWLLILWWMPREVGKFWLLTLPPFVIWSGLAFAGVSRSGGTRKAWPFGVLPLIAGGLLFLRTGTVMLRERQPDPTVERALNAWVGHSHPDDVLIENGGLTKLLLLWERRSGTVNLFDIIRKSEHESDRFVKLRDVMDQAARQRRAVLFSPGLTPYYSDDHLAFVGVTRQQVFDFFDEYPREGPLFEYQESDGGELRAVYRLVVHAK